MKKTPKFALLTAGPVHRILPARLPQLMELVGPVMGLTGRLSSRSVTGLRTGNAVKSWEELKAGKVFLVSGAGIRGKRLVGSMAGAGQSWNRRIVLLDEPESELVELVRSRLTGALVASITQVEPRLFLVDGDALAMHTARAILEHAGVTVYPIRRMSMQVFLASARMVALNLPPLLEAVSAALRHSGLAASHARRVVAQLVEQSLRSQQKAGRRAFREPKSLAARQQVQRDLRALESAEPVLADYHRRLLAAALQAFGEDCAWVEKPPVKRVI